MKKFVAFTLAETLIVMGVIGIVSALTLPNLNSSTGDKERVAKVKKIYQNLNDALGRAEAVYGPYDEWFINDTTIAEKSKRAGERITEFMKLSKNCELNVNQGCCSSSWDTSPNDYKVITADGTSLSFFVVANDNNKFTINADIDGPAKGTSTGGKDWFQFNYIDGEVRTNVKNETFTELVNLAYNKNSNASFEWILRYDNADYLKFKNARGLCPNGTTVTEANPRCK